MGYGEKNCRDFRANVNVILLFSAPMQLNRADRSFHKKSAGRKSACKENQFKRNCTSDIFMVLWLAELHSCIEAAMLVWES